MAQGVKTGGRKAGTPNKATADLREAAQAYTTEALEKLAKVMRTSPNDTAVISACTALLDRGHGKPTQPLAGDPAGAPIRTESETRLDVGALNADQLRALASIRVPAE